VTSDTGQNLRLDLTTGAATADGVLAYDAGDPNFGQGPSIVGVSERGESVFAIDSGLDVLALLQGPDDPPTDSGLATVGPLGVDTGTGVGFGISEGGNPLAVLEVAGQSKLYRIDLDTGAATLQGTVGGTSPVTITGGIALPRSPPQLQATPSPLTFGDQPLGTMGPVQTVTIALVGGDAAESFNNDIGGTNKDDFFLTTNLCQGDPDSSLEDTPLRWPGDSCAARIRFAPGGLGARTAKFRFLEPKCCPDPPFFEVTLTGDGTSAPFGPTGATGPTGPQGPPGPQGPIGPQGPPAFKLVVAAFDSSLRSTTGSRVSLRYVATIAANVTLDVFRGSKRIARIRGTARSGRNSIAWNGKNGKKAAAPGTYKLRLTAVNGDQTAGDQATVKVAAKRRR
jgi:hypothetical protein